MSHNFHQIWIHLVWVTKDRNPVLIPSVRQQLYSFIAEYAINKGFQIDRMNGVNDHVHCLLQISPTFSVSQIVHAVKGASSRWLNQQQLLDHEFSWQPGFAAFSVSKQNVPLVRRYIESQEEHHAELSFQEEIEKMREVK